MMQELKSGSLLQGGKYYIEEVLGQGGFGITYRAIMKSSVSGNLGGMDIEVPVAVKEFFMKDLCVRYPDSSYVSVPTTGTKEQMQRYREKFVKEARNISTLSHSHIVKVLDVFEENGTVYYVMQYLSGGSLRDRMRQGAMAEAEAVNYIRQVADALGYMHQSKHLCHYDVKPGNILIDKRGEAKLIDFGISKCYDRNGNETSTTPIGLSPGYAPFEQYQNSLHDFSPQSDIYSLGATLLALLTGETPPEAPQVIENGIGEQPDYISTNTWLAIRKSMLTLRKERPQTIADFLDILDNGLPVSEETVVVEEPAEDTRTRVVPEQQKTASEVQDSDSETAPDPFPTSDYSYLKYILIAVVVAVVVFACIFLFGRKTSKPSEATKAVAADTVLLKGKDGNDSSEKNVKQITNSKEETAEKTKKASQSSSQNSSETSKSHSKTKPIVEQPKSKKEIKDAKNSDVKEKAKKKAVDKLFEDNSKSEKQKAIDGMFGV